MSLKGHQAAAARNKFRKTCVMADEKRRQQWRESKKRSRAGEARGPAVCGTVSKYTLHRKAGEDCAECRTAWAAYKREKRQAAKG